MRPAISSTSSAALECKKAACHFCPAGRLLIGCAAAIVDRRASDDLASVAFTVATCHGRPKSQNENSGRRIMSIDGSRDEQLNEKVLRSYLIRCHRIVSDEYPEIRNMEPEKAADFLLDLRKTGRIDIQLYMRDRNRIGCRITERVAEAGPEGDE